MPSRFSNILFRFKATCFQLRRAFRDQVHPVKKHLNGTELDSARPVTEWTSDLWREGTSPREVELQRGKVQNLRVAAQSLQSIHIPADTVWSFWRQLGRTTVGKGYAMGRELREGCLVPMIGGGLCQLSGAIYNAALEAGLEIVERYAHSNPCVGTLARLGRDATVFWNYVDLRLRAPVPWRMDVKLDRDRLIVRIQTETHLSARQAEITKVESPQAAPNSCATCDLAGCHQHIPLAFESTGAEGRHIAVLTDEWWPEWQDYLNQQVPEGATIFTPLNGRRWGKANYAWNTSSFAATRRSTMLTLRRAFASRRLSAQGAARQRTLLEWDERLADHYARRLSSQHSHLIIAQNLLPFLWRRGWLGGRTFDVLMNRMPLGVLHERLDLAAKLHPASRTCADFRAPEELVIAEADALDAASQWITPHREIAKLARERATLLSWKLPDATHSKSPKPSQRIIFPATTLCRKGACELRNAMRNRSAELVLLGGVLEGADFWDGITQSLPGANWLDNAAAVVLPAFVENRPRRLLQALAAGVPVIASVACGLEGLPGVIAIPAGDTEALSAALDQVMAVV